MNLSRIPAVLSCTAIIMIATAVAPRTASAQTRADVEAVLAGDPLAEPQAVSYTGERFFASPDSGQLDEVDAQLRSDPDNVEYLIAAARARRNFGQFQQAIVLYSRAIELAPNDWRAYRFRGHRYISTRNLSKAIADLERARELSPDNFNVTYHLGLAYFIDGQFDAAADEYLRCLTVLEAADPGESAQPGIQCGTFGEALGARAGLMEWSVRALMRAERDQEAREVLARVPDGWEVEGGEAGYYRGLQFYIEFMEDPTALDRKLAQDLDDIEALSVANLLIVRGDLATAKEVLEGMQGPWAGFARIAAEGDLARMAAKP